MNDQNNLNSTSNPDTPIMQSTANLRPPVSDAKYEAKRIFYDHTAAMIQGVSLTNPTAMELYNYVVDECAFILCDRLIRGVYTPLEYNAIREELATLLWGIFENYVVAEETAELNCDDASDDNEPQDTKN